MSPQDWRDWLFGFGIAIAVIFLLRSQFIQWCDAQRRQRLAEDLVRQGRTPADAAKAAKMPFAQRAVFIGTIRLLGKDGLEHARNAQAQLFGQRSKSTKRYSLKLVSGEVLLITGVNSFEEALKKAGVHPANVVKSEMTIEPDFVNHGQSRRTD